MAHRGIVFASASIAAGAGAPAAAGVLPLVVAVIAVVVAACGGAIVLAALLRLDQRWPWAGVCGGVSGPGDVVREVVRCAEGAERAGAASVTVVRGSAGLRRGMRLIAEGASPEAVRETLEKELDRDLERRARGGGGAGVLQGLMGGGGGLAGVGLIVAGVAALGGAVWGAGTVAAGAAMTALLVGLALLSLRTPAPDELAAREAAEVLARTLVIRGVTMIAAGAGAREVEKELRGMLPGAAERAGSQGGEGARRAA